MMVGITSMEFPVMSRASGQARLGAHRLTGTATGAMAHLFAARSRCATPSSQPPTPARCRSTDTGPQREHHSGDDGRHLQAAADRGEVAVQAVLELGPGGHLIGQLLGVVTRKVVNAADGW